MKNPEKSPPQVITYIFILQRISVKYPQNLWHFLTKSKNDDCFSKMFNTFVEIPKVAAKTIETKHTIPTK